MSRIHMNEEGVFSGSDWKHISVEEMVNFLGIVLKISVDNKELGGYKSYFTQYLSVILSRTYYVELKDYAAWVMSLCHFMRIHASIHPMLVNLRLETNTTSSDIP
jgi:hypothetical protein